MILAKLYERIPKLWITEIKYLLSKTKKPNLTPEKKVYIFLAADYGNLGDIALTLAQKRVLAHYFPDFSIIEVPASIKLPELKGYIKSVSNKDVVSIIAGGNMGDVWSWFEIYRQLIIHHLSDNLIFQFPQTVQYTNSSLGTNLLNSAKRVYSGKNIRMMSREKMSFDFMKNHFSCPSFLTPDIVMTFKNWGEYDRNGILVCLRDDRECILSIQEKKELIKLITHTNVDYSVIDTKIDKTFIYEQRYQQLESLLYDISHSQVIITDRLHGMIFAYITGTPAIVLPNSNGKIMMSFEWISNCGFINYLPYFDKETFVKALDSAFVQRPDFSILEKNNIFFNNLLQKAFLYEE